MSFPIGSKRATFPPERRKSNMLIHILRPRSPRVPTKQKMVGNLPEIGLEKTTDRGANGLRLKLRRKQDENLTPSIKQYIGISGTDIITK